jgi:hypothetical protein
VGSSVLCLSLYGAASAAPAAVDGSEQPAQPLPVRRAARQLPASVQEYLANAPYAGEYALGDLVQSDVRAGRLSVRVTLPDDLRAIVEKDFPSTRPVRIAIRGSDLAWSVKCYGEKIKEKTVALACYDTEALAPFQCVALHVGPETVKVFAASFERPGTQPKLDLTQDAKGITYDWLLPGGTIEQRGRVTTLAELRSTHRAVMQTYLAPAMRRIGLRGFVLRHPAAEIYAAFPALTPDPAVARRLAGLLPRLGSPRVAERDAASAELAGLGRPGVLAVLRLDRRPLSAEQNLRIDLFLHGSGEELPRPAVEHDIDFYIDCLDDEDLQVRKVAKDALETRLGRPIDFDPALDADPRSAAVDRIYEQIGRDAPGAGTTRPSR